MQAKSNQKPDELLKKSRRMKKTLKLLRKRIADDKERSTKEIIIKRNFQQKFELELAQINKQIDHIQEELRRNKKKPNKP